MSLLDRFYLSLRQPPREHGGIQIYFDQENEFLRIAEALDLAATVDPLRYKLVQRYAPRILNSTMGTAYFDKGTKSANVNLNVLTEPIEIAFALVHEASHGWLHSRGIKDNARHERVAYYQTTRFLRRYLLVSGESPEAQRAWLENHGAWTKRAFSDSTSFEGRFRYTARILREGLKQIIQSLRPH